MKKPIKRSLVWFSNNLRTQSNQVIQEAINLSDSVFCIFIVDERLELKNEWGLNRIGPFRKKHQIDALLDLKQQLQSKEIQLHIYKGNPTILIPEICKRNKIETIFKQVDFAHDEIRDNELISTNSGIKIQFIDDNYLIPIHELGFPLQKLPDVFTQFRINVEKNMPVFYKPNLIQLSDCEVLTDENIEELISIQSETTEKVNGETKALLHLKTYIESGHARHYKETRNGLINDSDSTKLSPFLAMGCLNAKTVMHHVREHENEFGANESTYWIWFEILWRDYFRNVSAKFGKRIFLKNGI